MSESPVYKILLVGDDHVGKTSLARRFCEGRFDHSHGVTIGVDFRQKTLELGEHALTLSIWDVAGQGRFRAFRDQFYDGTLAVALVYDVTAPATFFNLPQWRDEVLTILPGVPLAVVGNKLDLGRVIARADVASWARFQGKLPFLETSALNGENVEEFFKGMAYLAYQQRRKLLSR